MEVTLDIVKFVIKLQTAFMAKVLETTTHIQVKQAFDKAAIELILELAEVGE